MRLHRGLLAGAVVCAPIFLILVHPNLITDIASEPEDRSRQSDLTRGTSEAQTYRYVTPSLAELGGRGGFRRTNRHVLILTRVPDAGGELLVLILQRLQGYNAFKHIRLPADDRGSLSTLQEELFVEEITSIVRQEAIPLSFDGDVRFLNFPKFGRDPPTFLSLIRDPEGVHNLPRYRENGHALGGRAIPTFCGQDPRCEEADSKWALRRAKRNVIEWYPFVGVLDCMEESLRALERKFPHFFRGAGEVYANILSRRKHVATCAEKTRIRGTWSSHPEDEIEFYQWVKRRLFNDTGIHSGGN